METIKKTIKEKYIILLAIGYILLFAPFVYSVFYSMPANDDFALGINWWGKGIIGEALMRAGWNYMHWFGQSGIFAVIIQVLFNPLYWLGDNGHSFGIYMIVVFLLVTIATLWAIRRLIKNVSYVEDAKVLNIATFLFALLLFTGYYYSDVYNWWSGVPGYSFMMFLNIWNLSNIAAYTNTKASKDYWKMVIIGIITCTSLMNCVATGVFYLLFVFIVRNKQMADVKLVKKGIPLALYIISGLLMAAAPGNFERQRDDTKPEYIKALFVTVYRIITRLIVGIKTRPWLVLIVLFIVVLGMAYKDARIKAWHLVLGIVCTVISAVGAIYPYVLGNGKDLQAEFSPRAYFIEDYLILIGFGVIAFCLGQLIANRIAFEGKAKPIIGIGCLISVVYMLSFHSGMAPFIPADIVKSAGVIKESYYYWEDIRNEAKNSPEDDVIIYRDQLTWSQYVYYTSFDDGSDSDWPVGPDIYYAGCNQAAAKLYGKNSITLHVE
ncbi:DUF6056 family protein [Pseudobutyrivibrio ruminis]|uniref:DUF6056 family protein n=1 Tax=Pseudobutyrivibrio ruminis TaxID=46206 RepID=UPI0004191AF4|nr:hypothetical protein [Pseudobutyrivibrio ruminis]